MSEKNKGGRPRKEVDLDLLSELCHIQCTAEECASVLKVSPDVIDVRLKEKFGYGFAEFNKIHSKEGKSSLRRLQWQSAKKGNVTMQIWLGKQWLKQTDKQDIAHTGIKPFIIEHRDGTTTELGVKEVSEDEQTPSSH